MVVENIFEQYFLAPIWDRTGYNLVNTAAYAIIAISILYLIYAQFVRRKEPVSKQFWAGALCWTGFGSSLRVITDAIDAGTFSQAIAGGGHWIVVSVYTKILQCGALDYGVYTVTPGIYIVTALLFFICVIVERKIGVEYWAAGVGLFLCAINLAVLSPMSTYVGYGLLVTVLAATVTFAATKIFGISNIETALPVFGHALDGAATWVAIDMFGPAHGVQYFEQHVVSRWIGEITPLSFGFFFLIKTGFALLAVKAIQAEEDKRLAGLALLAIAIMGLAPGIRDILRMVVGT